MTFDEWWRGCGELPDKDHLAYEHAIWDASRSEALEDAATVMEKHPNPFPGDKRAPNFVFMIARTAIAQAIRQLKAATRGGK